MKRNKFTEYEDSIIVRDDLTLNEIAQMLGRSYESVQSRRLRLNRDYEKLNYDEDRPEYKSIRDYYRKMGFKLLIYNGKKYYRLMISNTIPAYIFDIHTGKCVKQKRKARVRNNAPYIRVDQSANGIIFVDEAQLESFRVDSQD